MISTSTMKLKNWLINLDHKISFSQEKTRRNDLIQRMAHLKDQEKTCNQCIGVCCTFEKNSMQITPLESLEMLYFLNQQNRINDTLKLELEQNIKNFRLDQHISLKRGSLLRRYYTCPFYKNQSKGCSIDPEFKPYGCLAFNPIKSNEMTGDQCRSDTALLESIPEEIHQTLNQKIKLDLNLTWDKLPIPVALIEIQNAINQLPND